MEHIPLPKNGDKNLVACLILLNKEIEDLKKEIAELKAAQGA